MLLAEMLPHVLEAMEAGRIGPRQAAVLVEQWRELRDRLLAAGS